MHKYKINEILMNLLMTLLVTMLGSTFIAIGFAIYSAYWDNDAKLLLQLLIPFGVILSAALATTSMIKNIQNTNKIERTKNEEKIKNAEKYIDSITTSIAFSYDMLYKTYKSIYSSEKFDLAELMEEYPNPSLIAFVGIFPATNINTFVIKELDELSISFQDIKRKLEDKDLIYYSNKEDNRIFNFTLVVSRLIREINFCKEKYNVISFGSDKEFSQSIEYMKCLYLLIKFAKSASSTVNSHIHDEDLKIKF